MEAIQSAVVRRPPRIEAQRRRRIEQHVRCAQIGSARQRPASGPPARPTPQAGIRRTQARRPSRGKAMATFVVALLAGALMMIAAYMSTSGLRTTAWEKQETTSVQTPPAAPAQPAAPTGGYPATP